VSAPDVPAYTGRPIPAATLIVVDRREAEPRILMGRRRPDAVFLPDKFVFPGGRLEAGDREVDVAGRLPDHDYRCLLRSVGDRDPERAMRAFAAAALRETFEETGYLVAMAAEGENLVPDQSLNGVETGGRASDWASSWADVLSAGLKPDFSKLRFVARAITPPGRSRRYDTRFFLAEASAVHSVLPRTDGELSEIGWFSLDRLAAYDLPSITHMVLRDLRRQMSGPSGEIPFYFWRSGAFRRVVLKGRGGAA
jgi:8-oxo-dGTP pyrophosphatase MutT (NUDIX family)